MSLVAEILVPIWTAGLVSGHAQYFSSARSTEAGVHDWCTEQRQSGVSAMEISPDPMIDLILGLCL